MSKYSKHDEDTIFSEYLVKNVLQSYKLVEGNFQKKNKPDFQNENSGLEVTWADETLAFNGAIPKCDKNRIKNIEKFNKKFKKLGGSVFKKDDPIIKILNLHDTFNFHEDYVYIIPSYENSFAVINKKIKEKIEKLNSEYADLEHYYLGIFSPAHIAEYRFKDELKIIKEMHSNYNKRYEKIMIVFLDKICTFDLINNTYDVIVGTNEKLKEVSGMAAEQTKRICGSLEPSIR